MISFKLNRLIPIIVLALITLFIAYYSIKSIRANAWYFNARNTLEQLSSPIKRSELKQAEKAITLAAKFEPSHPHYWHLNAYIKILSVSILNQPTVINAPTHQLAYQQAEQALLKSIELRQTWAETWIALAQVVSYQDGPTEQVYDYIQQAKKVGPYKLDVHLGIIQIALIHWSQLTPQYKALYVNELKLAVKYGYKFNQVFAIAKQSNSLPILCLSLQFGGDFDSVRKSYIFKKHCGSGK